MRLNELATSHHPTWLIYYAEIRCAFLQEARVPVQFLSTPMGVLLPYAALVMLSRFFPEFEMGPLLLVIFGTLGTFNLGLIGVGLATARERAQGWMRLKRASPMPPLAHFVGKLAVTLLQAGLLALGLILIASFAGHLPVTLGEQGRILALITLGVLPFCALGLALAYAGGPNTAESLITNAMLTLIALAALPMFEGLPVALNTALLALNAVSPVYHFAVLTFGTTGLPALQGGPAWLHALALVGLTALFTILAIYLYRRDEGKTYG